MGWFAELIERARQWWSHTSAGSDGIEEFWAGEMRSPTRRDWEDLTRTWKAGTFVAVPMATPELPQTFVVVPMPAVVELAATEPEHEGAIEGWSPIEEQLRATTGELTRVEMIPSQVTVPEQRAPIMSELEADAHQALSGIDAAVELFRRRMDDIAHACTSPVAYRAHRGTQDTQLIPVVKVVGDRRVAHVFGTPLAAAA